MAGDEGFEPPMVGPEPTALPLGQSPTLQHQKQQTEHSHNKQKFQAISPKF